MELFSIRIQRTFQLVSTHIDTCDFCQYKFFHASSWLDFYFRKRPVISATTFGVRINYFI